MSVATGGLRRTVVLVVLALMALAPVAALVVQSVGTAWRYPQLLPPAWGVDAFGALLRTERLRAALSGSITLAAVTGLISTVLAYLAARSLTSAGVRIRRMGTMAAFLPVVAPPVALGVGLQVITLVAGLGGSWGGVLASHLVPATGYVTLYLLGVLTAYDIGPEEAARSLGASGWQVFRRITVPTLAPRLGEALWLGALVSWGQLALTLLVGAGAVRTLPVELLASLRAGDDRAGAAAALVLAIVPAVGLVATRLRRQQPGVVP